jgi:putative nucleotidyltransferase with HDIG domain
MTFLEPYSEPGAPIDVAYPDEQNHFTDVGVIARAPREVTHELASLLASLHERVSPNYRPREIILELLAELERKSAFTAQHSMRVATVARILAKSLQMDIVAVERISLAALLHDVGKLVIPIRILNKKKALSDAERRCIQTHAVFTDVILSAFPVFDAIRGIATLHHEHLNGTGYPFGYGRDRLSVETRIITVADIFVALTEDRPYRPGVSNSAALHKLQMLASEDIVDRRLVECAQEQLLPYNHSSAIWYPSRTAIAIALDLESLLSAG